MQHTDLFTWPKSRWCDMPICSSYYSTNFYLQFFLLLSFWNRWYDFLHSGKPIFDCENECIDSFERNIISLFGCVFAWEWMNMGDVTTGLQLHKYNIPEDIGLMGRDSETIKRVFKWGKGSSLRVLTWWPTMDTISLFLGWKIEYFWLVITVDKWW